MLGVEPVRVGRGVEDHVGDAASPGVVEDRRGHDGVGVAHVGDGAVGIQPIPEMDRVVAGDREDVRGG